MSEKNLIPMNKRSKKEVREIGRKGGVKSGQVRREKKEMREVAQMVLNLLPKISKSNKEALASLGIPENEMTLQLIAVYRQSQKAASGDLKALEFLRDTAGEKPTDKVDVNEVNKSPKVKIVIKGGDDVDE